MADVITISALNKYVRSILESDAVLTDIALSGEVSNFNRNHKTGHCYFSLKDEKASVKAVMFRSDAENLSFAPENGMRVVARGRISLYERDGAFQVYVEFLFPDGVGAAQMAFDQLKEKLEKQGLFALEHKRPLPAWPKRIGLVTSKTGAALQDILQVAQRRCPLAEFLLWPVTVQGARAPKEVAEAIAGLDALDDVDLMIVARGGGSAEDLGVFNDEGIARAAFACETPLISAIGHEIDFTILDFVVDLRAPTPSAAAELALPDMQDAMQHNLHVYTNIQKNMHFRLHSWYNSFQRMLSHPAFAVAGGVLARRQQRLDGLEASILAAKQARLHGAERRLQAAASLAAGLNPYAVLARGYSVARQKGRVLRSVQDAAQQEALDVILRDGSLHCRIEQISDEGLEEL